MTIFARMQQIILTIYFVILFALAIFSLLKPGKDTSQFKKIAAGIGISGIIFGLTLILINKFWYSSQSVAEFHWFNDLDEWLQMDKLGHIFTSFFIGRFCISLLKWVDTDHKKILIVGCFSGFLLLSPVEIMDGYSAGYGASLSDLLANFTGSLLLFIQYKWLGKILIGNSFSFHFTQWALSRPELLGASPAAQLIKDYNGQTYWFKIPVHIFFKKLRIPHWLCLSIGFGGEGMLGGDDNIWTDAQQIEHDKSNILRFRQVYISLDINWVADNEKKGWKNQLMVLINHFKIPAPTIELGVEGFKFHYIYF